MHSVEHGTHERFRAGCPCQPCYRAHRAALSRESWLRRRVMDPATRLLTREAAETDVTACSCGGLLAEDSSGVVWCLSCDPLPAGVAA